MFSALQASFLDDPEKGKRLRELESHFSAAHWFGDLRTGSELMQLAVPFVVLHVLMVGRDAKLGQEAAVMYFTNCNQVD